MIILEGADCTGKTTAAKRLVEIMSEVTKREARYSHMSKPPEDFDHLTEYVKNIRLGVQDRYHLGSIVYGAMLGRGSSLSAPRMELVQRHLEWQGCLVVIMHASRERLREILSASDKAEMYSSEDILRANDCYKVLAQSTNRGLKYCNVDFNVDRGFPKEETLRQWVQQWTGRWGL